jgi:hypothetical protein
MAAPARPTPRAPRPEETAWIAAIPCALLTLALIAVVGPPFGRAFLSPGTETFWARAGAVPEPEEHGRFLLALLGPPLLAAVVIAALRVAPRVRPATIRVLVTAGGAATATFVGLCLLAQNEILLDGGSPHWETVRFFTPTTLVVAAALAVLPAVVLRRREHARRVAGWLRETPARCIAGLAVATLATAAWLLTAVNLDSSIGNTHPGVAGHILWSLDEPFAILNGRTPLVDFHAQYGQLWPYVAALTMLALGPSLGVYTTAMATISGLALLALYAIFRRLTRSSLAALALFLPVLATGFFMKIGPLDDRYGPANLFSLWPVRYGSAYLLAWLIVRHLDGAAPRRRWPLFLAGGLVVLNNPEFGVPALGASLVALACARPPRSWAGGARLLGGAGAGLVAAFALMALLALARSGELPRFEWLLEFSRLYAIGGWVMLPMPAIGLHVAVFVTFAAAFVLGVVRAVRREDDVLLTSMLAWSGVFGIGIASYYAGRSHPQVLIDLFSAWALALALLVVVVVRELADREWRRPRPAELAVLFGFGLAICSCAQLPLPWRQIERLQDRTARPAFKQLTATRFVDSLTAPNDRVAILIPLGHRIAHDAGVVNVAPYASIESMPTREQLIDAIADIRAEGARLLFVTTRVTFPETFDAIVAAGFEVRGQRGETVLLADRRG